MDTKHKPAPESLLPFKWLPDEGQFIVDATEHIVGEVPCQGCPAENGAYFVHAANAYPKLVEALLTAAGALYLVEAHGAAESARAILRELGEAT